MSAQPPSTFDVIPAIDLRDGRVVRLREGDFAREDVFSSDPAEIAAGFAQAGALWIHVVDLDGAREGTRRQAPTIRAIAGAVGTGPEAPRLQVAGGLRSAEVVAEVLAHGAARVVLGTVALAEPELVAGLVAEHGADRVAVALDVRDGVAVGHGWVPGAPGRPVLDALTELTTLGVGTFVVTAIARDGLLAGPDLALLRTCIGSTDAAIIASGGIGTRDDLREVRDLGCRGAIIGRALYEGAIDLHEAIAEAARA